MPPSARASFTAPATVIGRRIAATFLALLALAGLSGCAHSLTPAEKAAGWISLFDGKSLAGWRANEHPATFKVSDGVIVAKGPRAHLFYVGPVQQHDFRNFELKLEVMTQPNSNSGVYLHTAWLETGFPQQGYEIQVNNSHKDPSRTGGVWGLQHNLKDVAVDRKWFTLTIRVEGKRVTSWVDDLPVADFTEGAQPVTNPRVAHRKLGSGTFALQAHDPEGETHFRNIRVRLLPDRGTTVANSRDE